MMPVNFDILQINTIFATDFRSVLFMKKVLLTTFACITLFVSCGETKKHDWVAPKYATIEIGTDHSAYIDAISMYGKEVLNLYRFAAMEADEIYWKQVFGDKQALENLSNPEAKEYASINYGPWDRISGKSFVEGYSDMSAGMQFYPSDMTQAEWEVFDDPDKFSPYTLIRRDNEGKLETVWYHDEYKENIARICDYLKAASDITIVPSVKEYLLAKIEGLKTDSYQASELKWLNTDDSKMDLILGPEENNDDNLHGLKRSYTAYVVLKNPTQTEKLKRFGAMMPEFQAQLPCDPKYKTFVPGNKSTIYVCDALYYAGAANCGIKDIAINLPFDTKVQAEKGTRSILMQNVISAKFNGILWPLANITINSDELEHVKDKAFFWNVAFREVAHGLGVKTTLDGRNVGDALENLAAAIEEVKALSLGVHLASGVVGKFDTDVLISKNDCYATFLTAVLRSARFGTESTVGKANVICYNYLKQAGAYSRQPDGCYNLDYKAFENGIEKLVSEVLSIQGEGNYEVAKQFIEKYTVIDKDLNADFFNMKHAGIPVDLKFNFVW